MQCDRQSRFNLQWAAIKPESGQEFRFLRALRCILDVSA